MALREELKKQGDWLFRWRSYLPMLLIIFALLGMKHFEYPLHSQKLDNLWEILCLFISLTGLGIRIFTIGRAPVGTSGTNTRKQIAELLNTSGMYSVVRHPMYLGNFIIWLGVSLFFRVWWISVLCSLIFWLYYERIIYAEEEFLRDGFGQEFLDWAEKTPAFIPKFSQWRPSPEQFSFKKVLRNESQSLFAIISIFTFIAVISDYIVGGAFEADGMWIMIFTAGAIFYSISRFLKKLTSVLDVDGW